MMPPQRPSRRAFLKRAGGGLAGALLGTGICAAEAPRAHPTIVLIVMDTVRRDHLSCYGYKRRTSPFLEKLAKTARVYQNAYATSCWTFPSHASLFTGLYPVSHGVHWEHRQAEEGLVTLAEVLRDHGYQALGLSENIVVNAKSGFAQGFERFTHPIQMLGRGKAAQTMFQEIVAQRGDKPLFVFVNLMAAHAPYNSSRQFLGTFLSDPAYADAYRIDILDTIIKGKETLGEKRLTHLTEHYDAEVRYVDYAVEQMAGALQSAGLWDSTLFVVTSDHGENLGDHDLVDHQLCLYESLVHIPLIVHYPKCFPPGSQEENPVQITDVFPTVLRVAGIDPEAYPAQGVSLLPGRTCAEREILCEYYRYLGFTTRKGPPTPQAETVWDDPRMQKFDRRLKSIRVGPMKYIRGSDGSEELYDLQNDPNETQSLVDDERFAAAKSKLASRLDKRMQEHRAAYRPPSEESMPFDEKKDQELKALGYL